jgi:hypothetical protein
VAETVRDAAPVPVPSPPTLAGERTAGAVLLRGGPFAGLAVAMVVTAGAVLVPVGLWRPGVALPVVLVGLSLAWRLSALVPVRPVPVWSAALAVAVAAGEAVWVMATHAEHVVLRRDAGSYALYAQWIATRHGLPVQADLDAFGGAQALAVPGFTLGSPAYYQVLHGGGADVVPQFLGGAPAVFSLGWWAGGWTGMLLVPAVVAGLAIFAVAALAARLIGPRWAPLAAGSLALAYPVLHTARSTYSEPVALVLMVTAALLVAEATVAEGTVTEGTVTTTGQRALGLVAGLTLGAAGLVRVDALVEVALVLPVCTVLWLRRHPAGGGLAVGVLAGTLLAAVSALLISRPYLDSIARSLVPLVAGTGVLGLSCLLVVLAGRRRGGRRGRGSGHGPGGTSPDGADTTRALSAAVTVAGTGEAGTGEAGTGEAGTGGAGRWVARAGWTVAWMVGLLGMALAGRPLWQTVRQAADDPGVPDVAGMQASQHLAVDGARTYAEWSLVWVAWWLGPVLVIAAWVGFAALARSVVSWLLPGTAGAGGAPQPGGTGSAAGPVWLAPAVVGFGSAVLTLWRPGITPDHPWADRRLVPVLLPVFVITATGVVAWSVRWARRRLPASLLVVTVLAGVAALYGPPLWATAPLAGQRTEAGELDSVHRVCGALQPRDVVVAVDNRGFNEWPQVIRGVCGRPAASLRVDGEPLPDAVLHASVGRLGELVDARGGRLVLLASGEDVPPQQVLTRLGLQPRQVTQLVTVEAQRLLAWPPRHGTRLRVNVWLAPWNPARPA